MDRHRAIAELLVEFVADKPREMTRRDTPIPSMPAGVNKPLALLGVRRSGKTFLMHQVMADLAAAGVPRERMVWVNFEDERLDGFSAQDLGLLLDLNAELFPAAAEG